MRSVGRNKYPGAGCSRAPLSWRCVERLTQVEIDRQRHAAVGGQIEATIELEARPPPLGTRNSHS